MRLALLLVCGLSVLFAALLAVQVMQPWSADGGVADATGVVPASRARVAVAAQQAVAPLPILHGDEWVATILARPLFTRDRRPASAAASVASADGPGALPRLTGIAISPQRRRAIFAGADGAKPIVVEEGGSIAGFTVQAIAPDGVTVHGPDGERTVALAFDPSPPQAPAAAADAGPGQPQPLPGMPQLPYPTPYPQPFPQFQQPGGPPMNLGRPGPQLDPTGQPLARPGFNRPRADLQQPGPEHAEVALRQGSPGSTAWLYPRRSS